MPTGERASGSQEQPKYDDKRSADANPESSHEPKGARGRPPNTQPTNQGPPVKTDARTKPNAKAKANETPKHDTEKAENRTKSHWREAKKEYLVDQLFNLGWKLPKTPDGRNAKLTQKELTQIMIDLLGI